jgi:hypothetical protein
MNTLIHADIFFFVTTVAVIVITIALTVLIVYLVKVFRSVRKIADAVSDETVLLRKDIADLRSEVRVRGARAVGAFDWLERFFGGTRTHFGNTSARDSRHVSKAKARRRKRT